MKYSNNRERSAIMSLGIGRCQYMNSSSIRILHIRIQYIIYIFFSNKKLPQKKGMFKTLHIKIYNRA